MNRQIRLCIGIAIIAFALPSCLTVRHSLPENRKSCDQIETEPDPGQAGVYIFFVNGHDPLGCANLRGVRDYLASLGFVRSYYGEIDHDIWLAEELVCANRDYPGSRFIVVGYEWGADSARRIVNAGLKWGATIDLLLYIEPKGTIYNLPACDPAIHRTVIVQNDRWLTKCAPVDNSEVINVSTLTRFGVPTTPEVIDLLTSEAEHLASMVPIIRYLPEPVPPLLDETAPPPRPLIEPKERIFDDWDFLKLMVKRPRNRDPQPVTAPANAPAFVNPSEALRLD